MGGRFLLLILALVFSSTVNAACLLLDPQAGPDCCHTAECPKVANNQPCLDCSTGLRSTAETPHATLSAIGTALARQDTLRVAVVDTPEHRRPPPDHSETYLRIGVLRL